MGADMNAMDVIGYVDAGRTVCADCATDEDSAKGSRAERSRQTCIAICACRKQAQALS